MSKSCVIRSVVFSCWTQAFQKLTNSEVLSSSTKSNLVCKVARSTDPGKAHPHACCKDPNTGYTYLYCNDHVYMTKKPQLPCNVQSLLQRSCCPHGEHCKTSVQAIKLTNPLDVIPGRTPLPHLQDAVKMLKSLDVQKTCNLGCQSNQLDLGQPRHHLAQKCLCGVVIGTPTLMRFEQDFQICSCSTFITSRPWYTPYKGYWSENVTFELFKKLLPGYTHSSKTNLIIANSCIKAWATLELVKTCKIIQMKQCTQSHALYLFRI